MQVCDWIVIGVILLGLLFGALIGFGRLLKIFTGGIIGVIISVVVTYFCLGVVSSWGFVQDLMAKLIGAMQSSENAFVGFLLKIGIEKIILAVGLFIVIQIIRIIIVSIIKGVVESDNVVCKVINKIGGAIFFTAIICMVALIVFHVVDLIGGATEENFRASLSGVFKLDWVFDNNPLRYIVERVVPQ